MNRRITIALGALAVAALGTGCTTFSDNNAVARVDDDSLSRSELVSLVATGDDTTTEPSTPGSSPAAGDESEPDTLSGDQARQWIGLWVQQRVLESVLADSDGEVTDADRQQTRQQLESQQQFTAATAAQQALYVDLNATTSAINRLNFNADEERASYEAGLEESGVACVGAIIVQSEAEAQNVVSDIEGGAEFSEVASSRNVDPQLASAGGHLGCAAADQLRQQLPPPVFQALVDGEVGELSQPIQLSQGQTQGQAQSPWVVVMLQPFDQVQDELAQYVGQDATTELVRSKANELDIHIDPRYGAYDPETGVRPLGGGLGTAGLAGLGAS